MVKIGSVISKFLLFLFLVCWFFLLVLFVIAVIVFCGLTILWQTCDFLSGSKACQQHLMRQLSSHFQVALIRRQPSEGLSFMEEKYRIKLPWPNWPTTSGNVLSLRALRTTYICWHVVILHWAPIYHWWCYTRCVHIALHSLCHFKEAEIDIYEICILFIINPLQ